MIVTLWLTFFFTWLFILGAAVGSFLNVVLYRLPRGKNLFWPPSRCGACFATIPFRDNVPLLSYWKLGGKCRTCGASFSIRYFLIELATGGLFVGLYYLEIGRNLHGLNIWPSGGLCYLEAGTFPPEGWLLYIGHTLLGALLLVSTACLLDNGTLPPSLAITGAIGGMCWSLLYPWPTPAQAAGAMPFGFVPWPVWHPLPGWLPEGSLRLGLVSGLAGLLVGQWLLRLVNALHRVALGEVVFGLAGPALVLMTGGFFGWQPVVVAVVLAVLVEELLSRSTRTPEVGFGLSLILALVTAWLAWRWLGPWVWLWLFDPLWLGLLLAAISTVLYAQGCARRKGKRL